MPTSAKRLPPMMTVAEFLEWTGDGTGTRYELVDGELRAQDGPSDAHGTIHSNVTYALIGHLRNSGTNCRVVVGAGVRPRVRADWNYRLPVLAVTYQPNVSGARDVPDPFLLVELLSPSNVAETWDNVRNYTTLPSVKEIVVIWTTLRKANVLLRDKDGNWPENPVEIEDKGAVALASIGYALPIDEIYRSTHLAE